MSLGLLAVTGLACAALLESVRQQHSSAAPLLVVVSVLVFLVLTDKKETFLETIKDSNKIPQLEPNPVLEDKEQPGDEFDGLALPDRVIYVLRNS